MDADHVAELFASFGPVKVRRMFGGAGIYADGIMFALISGDVIYLKADSETIPDFEREGLKPFTYAAKGRNSISLPYWRMPDRLYDAPDELAQWARAALMAARRVARKPRRSRQPTTRTKAHRR